MSHVIFDNRINLEEFSLKFQNIVQDKPFPIKIDAIFLDKEKKRALIPVISDINSQEFMFEMISMNHRTTLRIVAEENIAKPDFAKSAMGLITKSVLRTFSNIRIFSTNIGNHIPKRIVDKNDS
ncbi:MAG: hypothetical protein KGI28_03175 [Thaumarchaeota archaeon]|nr:hypothetical protein [Nitrososphaerota archaeon]